MYSIMIIMSIAIQQTAWNNHYWCRNNHYWCRNNYITNQKKSSEEFCNNFIYTHRLQSHANPPKKLQRHNDLHIVPGEVTVTPTYFSLEPVLVYFVGQHDDVTLVEPKLPLILGLKVVNSTGRWRRGVAGGSWLGCTVRWWWIDIII